MLVPIVNQGIGPNAEYKKFPFFDKVDKDPGYKFTTQQSIAEDGNTPLK